MLILFFTTLSLLFLICLRNGVHILSERKDKRDERGRFTCKEIFKSNKREFYQKKVRIPERIIPIHYMGKTIGSFAL